MKIVDDDLKKAREDAKYHKDAKAKMMSNNDDYSTSDTLRSKAIALIHASKTWVASAKQFETRIHDLKAQLL